jgi:hypothetical protein
MKKMTALLIAAGIVLVSFSIANGHSDWAKYRLIPVPDYVIGVPEGLIFTEEDALYDEDVIVGTINCCACHGEDAGIGPGFKGFCK